MESRKMSELLKMVYNELWIHDYRNMCSASIRLYDDGKINADENFDLMLFFHDKKPINAKFRNDMQFWKEYRAKPRLRYLRKHIKKQEKLEAKNG